MSTFCPSSFFRPIHPWLLPQHFPGGVAVPFERCTSMGMCVVRGGREEKNAHIVVGYVIELQ